MLAVTYGKRNSGIRLTAFVMSSVFFVYKINFRSFDSATAPAVRPLAVMPVTQAIQVASS
jgi:hypothetical protein